MTTNSQSGPFSVAILAGGKSKRMGQNKALLKLNGISILQRVINTVNPLTNDLFLVTNSPDIYHDFALPMVPDIIPHKAALGGIYTAIEHAKNDWVFVVACDMPLLNPKAITFLADQRQGADIVVPLIETNPETLHAFYKKSCLPAIEKPLQNNNLKIIGFFDDVSVKYIDKQMLKPITTNFDFLINLNTPQELNRIKSTIEKDFPN